MGGMGMDMDMCSSLLRLVPVPVALPAASCSCMQLRRARRQQRRRQQRRHDRDKHSKRHAPPPRPRPPPVARKQSSQLAGRALARKRCANARRSVIFFASLGNGGANGGYFYAVRLGPGAGFWRPLPVGLTYWQQHVSQSTSRPDQLAAAALKRKRTRPLFNSLQCVQIVSYEYGPGWPQGTPQTAKGPPIRSR
jgi:hypothetical protein